MLLQLYALLVLCYDALQVGFGIIYAISESLYTIFKPPVLKPVEGEIALVVGAGHGVGREFALQLASLGAVVICWDADEDANKETVGKVTSMDNCCGKALAYHCDISDRGQIMQTAQRVQKEVGNVSILVHCSGVSCPCKSLSELTMKISKAMTANVFLHFWVLEAFLPHMTMRNHGHIVMLSSVAGLSGVKEQVALRTAQFAIQGLAESLAEELRVKCLSGIHLTLAHVHPTIISHDLLVSAPARIPCYFGVTGPKEAAHEILKAMRRNYAEVSVPHYLFYLGNMFRILSPKTSKMLREVLDTGVEAC